jgi:ribosomal-protein-alanine N-acetyltransferase
LGYSEAVFYRPYTSDDFPALYAIEEACFQAPLRYSRSYMRQLLKNPNAAAWIAEDAGIMCGFAIVEWTRESQGVVAYVQTIEVLPEFRGCGGGRELLRLIEGSALAAGAVLIWLHVDVNNSAAIRLYEAHGYVEDGRREDYYEPGRAAFLYAKELQP